MRWLQGYLTTYYCKIKTFMGVVIFIIVIIIIIAIVSNSGNSTKPTVGETEQQRLARLQREREARERQTIINRQRQAENERQASLQRQQAQQQQQRLALQRQQFKTNRLALQETGTDYANAISNLMQPTPSFWRIYEYNVSKTTHLSVNQILNNNNGVAIIQNSQNLINYIAAYAGMHYHKLQTSFTTIFSQLPNNAQINIVDYGCGQALATIAFYDYAIRHNKNFQVDKIILIEPSDIALKRGILKLNYFIDYTNQHTEISKVNKSLDQLLNNDLITSNTNIKIHLLSNILDVDSFNYIQLANKIRATQRGINYFICVSPDRFNALNRIVGFQNCFNQQNIPCETGTLYKKIYRVANQRWIEAHQITMVQKIFRCNI